MQVTPDSPATAQPDIRQLPLGPLQTNCYFLGCRRTRQAVFIDPGWDGRGLANLAAKDGYTVSAIWLTHSHFDHIGGLADLKAVTDAPIYAHRDALPMLRLGAQAGMRFGVMIPEPPEADRLLAAGDELTVGDHTVRVLYTPGHAPGHVCFYLAAHAVLFDGDVLFQGSIGRTDLPGADYATLMQSIDSQLLALPDETQVLSGHGSLTTIGRERKSNPFL